MSSDDQSEKECPLCMEPFELDDINFYPCKCEYQICRFCWHRIRTDENGLCPACRQQYPEDPVNFKPLSTEELQKIKSEKKQKQQQQRLKMSESRKHLANFRVLQKNLVYVVGLSSRVADPDTLKKPEFFGKYGRIHKVVVGTSGTGAQSSSSTAYVTYYKNEDALRAIQSVNNAQLDGRVVKASLGTTKYCSSFLRNQQCHKQDCMYLHEQAEMEVSFTKDDMHQGRHTEYERKLAEQVLGDKRRSPKLLDPGDVTTTATGAHRRNAPPRHRNKQCSKSVERSAPKTIVHSQSHHHRTCSNHSLTKPVTIESTIKCDGDGNGDEADDEDANMQIGSVPSESWLDDDKMSHVSHQPPPPPTPPIVVDEPVSRLHCWTQPMMAMSTSISAQYLLTKNASLLTNGVDGDAGAHCSTTAAICQQSGADWSSTLGGIETNRAHIYNCHSDDDLGFDPFSESSKGLADLLEQEKQEQLRERQRAVLDRPSTANLSTQGIFSGGWTNRQAPSSSPFMFSAAASSWEKSSSSYPPPPPGMIRPPTNSPIPQHFTTPPPTLPVNNQLGSNGGQFDTIKSYQNGGGTFEWTNGGRPIQFSAPPPIGSSSSAHQRSISPHDPLQSIQEWQDGLKALLPNVNVTLAPELLSTGGCGVIKQSPPSKQQPLSANRPWLRHAPPMFTQPPPPLSISTSSISGGIPVPMRPSPTSSDGSGGFSQMPPRPPPGYPKSWQTTATLPPPGFSPGKR